MSYWKSAVAAAAIAALSSAGALAQEVKLGIVNTYSGPFAAVGEQLDRGIRLYMQQHEKDLPPGVKLDIIRRDDTGPNPEVAKRMAQELITRDHVQLWPARSTHRTHSRSRRWRPRPKCHSS